MADEEPGRFYRPFQFVLVAALFASAGYFLGSVDSGGTQSDFDLPEKEVNVTCYVWTENGTTVSYCDPSAIYAPNSFVNIRVKNCEEYEYHVDEEAPCEREVNTSGLPTSTGGNES